MNRLLPFALALFAATMFFTACGDDDSSSFVEPEKESSSSEILSSGDGTSDGNGDKSSSSVSSSSTNSSSSAKSSSSTDSKSSSSVTSSSSGMSAGSSAGGSSSSLKTCPPEKEGNTRTVMETGEKQLCQGGYWVPVSSSSAVPTSSYFDMTNQFNEKVSYGEFTDPRDGQKYRTVREYYGSGGVDSIEVFAQNLNYGKQVKLGTLDFDDNVVEKFCYNDDPWYCDNGFGGLYSWSETLGLPKACDSVRVGSTASCPKITNTLWERSVVQGACPEGWHVMNEWEWGSMKGNYETGSFLVSKVTRGNNLNGFSALLGGGSWGV